MIRKMIVIAWLLATFVGANQAATGQTRLSPGVEK
jgi:hypothetical protein